MFTSNIIVQTSVSLTTMSMFVHCDNKSHHDFVDTHSTNTDSVSAASSSQRTTTLYFNAIKLCHITLSFSKTTEKEATKQKKVEFDKKIGGLRDNKNMLDKNRNEKEEKLKMLEARVKEPRFAKSHDGLIPLRKKVIDLKTLNS